MDQWMRELGKSIKELYGPLPTDVPPRLKALLNELHARERQAGAVSRMRRHDHPYELRP